MAADWMASQSLRPFSNQTAESNPRSALIMKHAPPRSSLPFPIQNENEIMMCEFVPIKRYLLQAWLPCQTYLIVCDWWHKLFTSWEAVGGGVGEGSFQLWCNSNAATRINDGRFRSNHRSIFSFLDPDPGWEVADPRAKLDRNMQPRTHEENPMKYCVL